MNIRFLSENYAFISIHTTPLLINGMLTVFILQYTGMRISITYLLRISIKSYC